MRQVAMFCTMALLLGFGAVALAQDPAAAPAAAPAAVADAPADDAAAPAAEDPSWDEFWEGFKKIITDWRTLGVFGGLSALIGFLLIFLRLKFIDTWLEERKLKWLKVVVGSVLGGLAAMFGAVSLGAAWVPDAFPNAFVAGLAAGLTATGVHSGVTGFTGAKKK